MRHSILRRFRDRFGAPLDSKRSASRRSACSRRLSFERFEERQMFAAADIFAENMHSGATDWQVRSPSQDVYDQNDQLIALGERPRAPYGIAWNGFTDSTQTRYSDRIQGFTTRMSYDLAEPNLGIEFKVDSPTQNYAVEIYRLGYYNGAGARLVAKLENRPQVLQPPAPLADGTGLRECSNWTVTATWAPAKNTQGEYVYTTPGEQQA